MSGRELIYTLVDRARGRNVVVGKKMTQRFEIELGRDRRVSKDSLRFRGVDQLSVKDTVVNGFLAEAVASDNKLFLPGVPQRNSKHSVEMVNKIIAIFLIKVWDDLGVGLRDEFVAGFFQLFADLTIVVQL